MEYIIYFKISPFTLDFLSAFTQSLQGYENSSQASRVWN